MAKSLLNSSIGRKFAMALSALFLLVFLLQHFLINFLSVISPEAFNSVSHFMGYNPLVQFLLQPVLLFGVIFHFIMGFILELQNKKARGGVNYSYNKPASNSTWASRNMLISGAVILAFLGLHFYDFWFPEMNHKYIHVQPIDEERYWLETVHKFKDLWRVIIYILSFVLLSLHLQHGFQSAFQSMGANHNKYTPMIKKLGTVYAYLIPAGFIFIALYHYITQLS